MVKGDYTREFQSRPLADRIKERNILANKYPTRSCVIVDRASGASNVPMIDKHKFLVPNDLTFGQFITVVRKRLKLDAATALFFFVQNSVIPSTNATMGLLMHNHKSADGYLYITYNGESVFGS
jgi:GABA(A) receptor-associated protein